MACGAVKMVMSPFQITKKDFLRYCKELIAILKHLSLGLDQLASLGLARGKA